MNQGKVSENVIKRSVLKNLNNGNRNSAGLDCAIFTGYVANEGDDSCVAHAIVRACNNAYVSGYWPKELALSITMPEHMREIRLKKMIIKAQECADEHELVIADGHTETVGGITKPIVTATVVAVKEAGADGRAKWMQGKLKSGQAIVMTKWMAMSGSARIAKEHRTELASKLPEFIIDDACELERFISLKSEAAVAMGSDAICMNDCSDGGVFAALWQLADQNGVGLSVNLKAIPVRQETIEVCEFFDINPYKLRSDGAMLIVTDESDELIDALNRENINAVRIGEITEGIDRVIVSGEDHRFLEEPRQDEGVML